VSSRLRTSSSPITCMGRPCSRGSSCLRARSSQSTCGRWMGRRAAIGRGGFSLTRPWPPLGSFLVVGRLVAGNRLFQYPRSAKKQLLGIELPPNAGPKLRTLQLCASRWPQAINLRKGMIRASTIAASRSARAPPPRPATCSASISAGSCAISLTRGTKIRFACHCDQTHAAGDSKGRSASRRSLSAAQTVRRRACQTRPIHSRRRARRAADAVSRIMPSLIGGHRKAPCSSRFPETAPGRTRPTPNFYLRSAPFASKYKKLSQKTDPHRALRAPSARRAPVCTPF